MICSDCRIEVSKCYVYFHDTCMCITTVKTCIKTLGFRLILFLYIRCCLQNQPENVLKAECSGSRCNTGQGKGIELPVDYSQPFGNAHYLGKLIEKLRKKQEKEGSDWKISDLRKCDCHD